MRSTKLAQPMGSERPASWHGGERSWRGASVDADAADPQGRALQPLIDRFDLPRSAFEALIDGVEMDLVPAPLRDLRRALRVLHPRGVGGRSDVRRDLRLSEPAIAGATRSSSASRCSSPTSCGTFPVIWRRARLYIPLEDLGAPAAPRTTCAGGRQRRRRRAIGGGQCAARLAGGAGARLLCSSRRARCRGRTRAAWSRPKSWARSTAASSTRIERGRLRRLQPRDSRPARRSAR